jgi:DNA-3-methyladenine glycosylase I
MTGKKRCPWADSSELMAAYHDTKWGRPVHDDRELFKMLILEGQQAGLSWLTVLRKTDNYVQALDNFEIRKIAGYGSEKIESLLQNPGLIRSRLKISSIVTNARAALKIQAEHGSLDRFLWSFTGGRPILNSWTSAGQVPAETELSGRLSRELKAAGFKFIGPAIAYSFMQAAGLVNDHLLDCFCRKKTRPAA